MNKLSGSLVCFVIAAIVFTACKKRADDIIVYPNPATSFIIFDATSSANKHKNGKIVVRNTVNEVIKSFNTDDSSRILWQIDSVTMRGVYFYSYTADRMKTQKGQIQFN